MNHFVDAGNVQQHGLTCLLAFTTLGTVFDFIKYSVESAPYIMLHV